MAFGAQSARLAVVKSAVQRGSLLALAGWFWWNVRSLDVSACVGITASVRCAAHRSWRVDFMNHSSSSRYVRIIKGQNAGRCGRVVARHTYPAHITESAEIHIVSVRISGLPTEWYRIGASDPLADVIEITEADAERAEKHWRRAA